MSTYQYGAFDCIFLSCHLHFISLKLVFGKISERIIFKDLFNYFHKNQFFTKCKSGFLPGDSCISQLLSIVDDINSFFDCDPTIDVRGVFSDISKAFDEVCHDGISFKLKTYTVKSVILILRKKILKTSKRLLLLSNILLVRQISHFLLTKNLPKYIFA